MNPRQAPKTTWSITSKGAIRMILTRVLALRPFASGLNIAEHGPNSLIWRINHSPQNGFCTAALNLARVRDLSHPDVTAPPPIGWEAAPKWISAGADYPIFYKGITRLAGLQRPDPQPGYVL